MPLLFYAALIGALFTQLPPLHWLLEINSSLGFYYLPWLLIGMLLVVRARRRLGQFKTALLILLHCYPLSQYAQAAWPFYFEPRNEAPQSSALQPRGSFSLVVANLYRDNTEYQAVKEQLLMHHPDVIGLTEFSPDWESALQLEKLYPYSRVITRSDHFGIALYSRFELVGEQLDSVGPGLPPLILTDLQIAPEERVTLGLVHAQPPVSSNGFYNRKLLLRRLSSRLKFMIGRFVVAGDFNATPLSVSYRVFTRDSGFRDAAWGYGLARTWDMRSLWRRFTIDHVLYRGGLSVSDLERLTIPGSDHAGYFVAFNSY